MQKGEPMAEITVPINVNLPDDWVEQIVNRLRNDPNSEWAEVTRCKECKYWEGEEQEGFYYFEHCQRTGLDALYDDFCSYGEKKGKEHE